MQIHEITQSRLDEGIVDAVKSGYNKLAGGISGAKQGVRLSRSTQQAQLLANKAFPIWKTFAAQIRAGIKDPAKLQAFDNRTDGVYEKNLLAFVQKNLLGGAYLPNLTNKDEILALVKQLSAPTISNPATIPPNQLTEALSPAQEKELFTQLVTQGTLAQNVAAGAGEQHPGNQPPGNQPPGGDARSMVQGLQQVLASPTGGQISAAQLQHIGKVVTAGFAGTPNIKSTGNPGVDALLIAMGFQGI